MERVAGNGQAGASGGRLRCERCGMEGGGWQRAKEKVGQEAVVDFAGGNLKGASGCLRRHSTAELSTELRSGVVARAASPRTGNSEADTGNGIGDGLSARGPQNHGYPAAIATASCHYVLVVGQRQEAGSSGKSGRGQWLVSADISLTAL